MTKQVFVKPGTWLQRYLVKKRLKAVLRRKPRPAKVKEQTDD